MKSISVVLPIYNEESGIKDIVLDIIEELKTIRVDSELILVDDGSSDRTSQILRDLCSQNLVDLKIITHQKNLGYGAALVSGFKIAKKELVVYMDSDGQFSFAEAKKLFNVIDDRNCIVTGVRVKRADSLFRCILGRVYTHLACFLFSIKSSDLNCGLKLFNRALIDNTELLSRGALINAELFYHAKSKGYSIIEVPVAHYPRKYGKQSGASLRVVFEAFMAIFVLRSELKTKNKV